MGDISINNKQNNANSFNQNTTECFTRSVEDMNQLNNITFWVEGVGILSVSVIGVILNLLAIIVLTTRKSMQNLFNHLLISLFCADIVFLFVNIINSTFDVLIISDYLYLRMFPKFIYPCYWMTMTLSILLTVAISHERYNATR